MFNVYNQNSKSSVYRILDQRYRNESLNWEPYSSDGREGVSIVRLFDARIDGAGPVAALLKYGPGASVPAHLHRGFELIYVLDGELINDAGVHGPGTLEICSPGSTHSLQSKSGCTFLVVWAQPVLKLA